MDIDLPKNMQEELRSLAVREHRDVGVLVEEAVRQYLEAAAITDLDPAEIAEAQVALASELRGIPDWKGGRS